MAIDEIQHCTLGFTRLAINGLTESGNQPMKGNDGLHWICNGEIYNWAQLSKRHGLSTNSESDCSVIGPLFRKLDNPAIFFKALDGVFAILIYDEKKNCLYAGRDPYGVRPMFYGKGKENGTFFGSELKSIV